MAEVSVDYRAESENIILHIQGRIDGIYEKEDQVVIEEIKTTTTELEIFIERNSVLHWAQVKIYAAIFAQEHHLSELHVQLTYFQVETQKIQTLDKQFTAEELNVFLQTTIANYLEWLDKIELWHKERDARISMSNFPYRFFRDGQIDMIADVANAIKHQEQLMIQAPTGIGKPKKKSALILRKTAPVMSVYLRVVTMTAFRKPKTLFFHMTHLRWKI